ncbi:MAG TPA: bifunctional riboflavin kinase/FAD synthetase [Methylomirabilota bacterium]|nr:bifunctional riboflavin kinase/FAD synthetase [Methylomirabilota bacterium]
MKLVHRVADLAPQGRKVCVAIGMFDGVHLGHQQVIRQAVTDAEQYEGLAVALTFDRHPNAVVAPERVPPLIYSLPQKLRCLEALGVDVTLLLPFDESLSRKTGEEFVLDLAREPGSLQSVCVGAAFTFGHKRSGDLGLLRRLGAELGFAVHGVAAVSLDGEVVSSTRIREAVSTGKLDFAGQMLGRTYALASRVVRGDQLGRKLGFPTANLDVQGRLLPPAGVYAVHARVQGQCYRAVLNIGTRPTLAAAAAVLRAEVHLLDFEGDLYDRELEVTFTAKLRDERRFPSLDELRRQIATDVAAARRLFAGP